MAVVLVVIDGLGAPDDDDGGGTGRDVHDGLRCGVNNGGTDDHNGGRGGDVGNADGLDGAAGEEGGTEEGDEKQGAGVGRAKEFMG